MTERGERQTAEKVYKHMIPLEQAADLMAVDRTVECNGTTPISRAQYSDVHIVILLISLSE